MTCTSGSILNILTCVDKHTHIHTHTHSHERWVFQQLVCLCTVERHFKTTAALRFREIIHITKSDDILLKIFYTWVSDDVIQQVKSFSRLQETDLKLAEFHFLSSGQRSYLVLYVCSYISACECACVYTYLNPSVMPKITAVTDYRHVIAWTEQTSVLFANTCTCAHVI